MAEENVVISAKEYTKTKILSYFELMYSHQTRYMFDKSKAKKITNLRYFRMNYSKYFLEVQNTDVYDIIDYDKKEYLEYFYLNITKINNYATMFKLVNYAGKLNKLLNLNNISEIEDKEGFKK